MQARRIGAQSLAILALAALVATGCNKPRKRVLTKEQTSKIQSAILTEAPTPKFPVGANFDGVVELVGVDLSSPTVKVGSPFTVTYYWKVLKDMPKGVWKIFVHFELPGKKRTTHDHQGVNELLPLNKWKAGQIIKDEQRITVHKDFQNGGAKLYVGIFDEAAWKEQKQNVRMKIINKDKIKNATGADHRVEVVTVNLTGSKAKAAKAGKARPAAKRYTAVKWTGEAPIVIDGKLNEPGWRAARPTPAFGTPSGQRGDLKLLTQARMTWDDKFLYVGFTTRDKDIFSDRKGRDAKLWERDCVEIYLDPGADGRDYVELQISPNGDIFDAHFSTRRKPNWPDAAKRLTLNSMVAKISMDGTPNKQDDTDRQWTVETAIPWAELPGVSGPPKEGETWAVNLYRIDAGTPGGRTTHLSWTAAGGDFHNLAGFGKVTFSAKAPARRQPRLLNPGARPKPSSRVPTPGAKPGVPAVKPAVPGAKPAVPGAKPALPGAKSSVTVPGAKASVTVPGVKASVTVPGVKASVKVPKAPAKNVKVAPPAPKTK